ncbi:MAG: ArsR/SmtB family transcription factor [Geminicoccaceae bacterium]
MPIEAPSLVAEPIDGDHQKALLDRVFFALSDSTRREILERLGDGPLLVSELAAPFDISLQAVSRHIQVLVRAGLVQQQRTGRISSCSLDVETVYSAAVWLNQYRKYWPAQFDSLAGWLEQIDARDKTGSRQEEGKGQAASTTTKGKTS